MRSPTRPMIKECQKTSRKHALPVASYPRELRYLCQGYIYSLGARRLCIDENIHTKDRVLGEEVLRGAEGSELYAILAEIEISSRISLMDSSSDSSSAGE
ncbi:hypothetical protein Ac2012v2_005291 [Leucoagaricus gongylophorus]